LIKVTSTPKKRIFLWSTHQSVLKKNKEVEAKINKKQKIKLSFLAQLDNFKQNSIFWLKRFPIFNLFQLFLLYT